MNKELKRDLAISNLQKYIEIFEEEGLHDFSDLESLTEDDYEKIGVTALGDRKKLVKLYHCQEQHAQENSYGCGYQQDKQPLQTMPIIVNNADRTSGNGCAVGFAGVLGGILGSAAVIAFILYILSNITWQL